ncbi:mitochodrial transcription termination factor [Chloropicon primus]|uniref:Mitochodrial transcription termination factor n=1 Tax=Chloropicon primus TaxID=1764295 RepID=A0A5B8MFA8_9CHLO|nr:mitochodrial transcription termination factor [Chloropicon primus]UPQ97175.1 mitochodrial transcription termination factor [Chloropicon primus]|eukprot:QDZ17960.1 mitochodrial transcription termination factor [Chloropicon primus]
MVLWIGVGGSVSLLPGVLLCRRGVVAVASASLGALRLEEKEKLERVAQDVTKTLDRDIPEAMLPQLKYLIGIGARAEDLSKVAIREILPHKGSDGYRKILHRPDLLRSRVGFYQGEFGVKGESIGKMIVRSVNSLFILQDAKVQDKIRLLYGLGMDKRGVSRLLVRSPSFFSLKTETLETKIGSLRRALSDICEHVDQNALLLKILELRPQVLSRKSEKVTDLLEGLVSYGFAKEEVVQMILKNPSILGYDLRSMEEKLKVLEGNAFQKEQVIAFMASSPKLFDLSVENNFKPTLGFFLGTGWTIEDLCRFPQVLNYSLSKRIRPRHDYIRRKEPNYETAGRYQWIVLSDSDFAKRFGREVEER